MPAAAPTVEKHPPKMLAVGAIIYTVMALVWVGIGFAVGPPPTWVLVPFGLAAAFGLGASVRILVGPARSDPESPEVGKRIGKHIGILVSWEGIAIGVGSGALAALELPQWIPAWAAMCVGLHFFPLAKILSLPMDVASGTAICLAVVGVVVALPTTAWGVAIALATSAILLLAGLGRLFLAGRNA